MESIGEVVNEVRDQFGETREGQPVPVHGEAAAPPEVGSSPLDLPAEQFQAGLDRRRTNRRALMQWIGGALVEGTDYGSIPTRRGPSKPSLWKPGAEKICGMLGITVHLPTLHEYEQAALQGVQLHHVILRCELRDSAGRVVADGVGARSLKQDQGDLNKTLKMSAKSAHIDATLRLAGLSEVFTQDLEDMAGAGQSVSGVITEEQHRALEARIRELELDRDRVRSWVQRAWGIEYLNQVPQARFRELYQRLEVWARKQAAERQEQAAERQAS